MNLGNLLSASAARNPRKTACVLENESISYESWTVRRHPTRDSFFGRGASPRIGMPDPASSRL
jgi:hypothetical protein